MTTQNRSWEVKVLGGAIGRRSKEWSLARDQYLRLDVTMSAETDYTCECAVTDTEELGTIRTVVDVVIIVRRSKRGHLSLN